MHTDHWQEGRIRRLLNDLVLAEVFLVQATIESAQVIGEGLSDISEQVGDGASQHPGRPSLSALLQRTAGNALEPYTARVRVLRQLADSHSEK